MFMKVFMKAYDFTERKSKHMARDTTFTDRVGYRVFLPGDAVPIKQSIAIFLENSIADYKVCIKEQGSSNAKIRSGISDTKLQF